MTICTREKRDISVGTQGFMGKQSIPASKLCIEKDIEREKTERVG